MSGFKAWFKAQFGNLPDSFEKSDARSAKIVSLKRELARLEDDAAYDFRLQNEWRAAHYAWVMSDSDKKKKKW